MRHRKNWTSQKIKRRLGEIRPKIYKKRAAITPFQYAQLAGPTRYPSIEWDKLVWEEIPVHNYWGKPRTNFLLKTSFTVPEDWADEGRVALHLPIGIAGDFSHPEALVYIDGQPFAACDRHHQEVILPAWVCDGVPHALTLHGWTGIGGSTVGNAHQLMRMEVCELVQIDLPTRDFEALGRVALEISAHLDENDPAKHHLLTALDDAFRVLDLRIPIGEGFYSSVPQASAILKEGVSNAGPPIDVDITAIGHAHIDVAWLWTLGQTRQKAGRTFHTVLRLMDQFPEFQFTQSQPQLYEYVRQDFPELFEEIGQKVAEGRWEPIGGMWVEADCNLTGPESLARQFILGRKFFTEKFGARAETPVLWLPDVFGYAWNLPQLIKQAGLEYFFTIKIGWSQYNRLPYDSFWWQGLDGTKVLTHFSTTKNPDSVHASTYNSDASPGQTLGTWFNFQQKDAGPPGQAPPLLMSYGWGDGGGGPTREMLENLQTMKEFPSTPRVQMGKVYQFFQELESRSGAYLPVWNGELYLEYHRGTYTTQGRVKRANRKSEFLLHDAEFLAVVADLVSGQNSYPAESLEQAWKLVCLNQFHDIIPGSSIGPVYEEAHLQYQEVSRLGRQVVDDSLAKITSCLGGDFLVINPTGFARDDLLLVPESLTGIDALAAQEVAGGKLISLGSIPPYTVMPLQVDAINPVAPEQGSEVIVTKERLENVFLRLEISPAGDITRIYDKVNQREVLPQGEVANQLQAFEDRPLSWDAWDIEIYYEEKKWLAEPAGSIRVVEAGPLRGTIEIRRKILTSEFVQLISLDYNSPRLNFSTTIDWQERKTLLKAAFPVDVFSPTATYEVQWGNVERPTHRNTSWDWARFETAAQKWVDLSEGGYGVSLLNDSKYGHDIYENVIRLTLLRGTIHPDPDADLGEHHFAYSLLPHGGRWDARTVSSAYALNDPLIIFVPREKCSDAGSPVSLIQSDQPNIVIETIKQAEDAQGIVVRLYESQRKRGKVVLRTGFLVKDAWLTNLLEENQEEVPLADGNTVILDYRPYQIITLRLAPEGGFTNA
jgi:alpha-mannosidase